MRKQMPTQEQVKQLLHYDPLTGIFTRLLTRGPHAVAGDVAGHRGKRYSSIGIDGVNYMSHILAWIYMTGQPPAHEIDHEDGDGHNNVWANLRLATRKQNMENTSLFSNNTSGYRGVTWYRRNNKWGASAFHNGKRHFAGLFDDVEEAGKAAKALRDKLFTHHHTSHAA